MKANEFRIGNLLRDKVSKTELKVIELTEKDFVTYVIDRSKFPLAKGWGIEPIPLTEEWLLRFGFEIKKGKFGNEYHLLNFSLYTSKEQTICFVYDDFLKDIYYVHQLQNLYFALTGEELTLKTEL
jgi:hypothetical protein